ncbi:hypothetical protein SAMN04487775_104111 [Treponema bryantii]|uniref:Phage abortive infection protein n=1 Tax=Treponema bryantii TaxID=163 RepID=A0A1I3K7W0_9SPIR|nr:hypothetical protein [Treponema bryantii]SFI68265.1 hypothetical protein SAMN04487775_104111 [Treponema bryantii]
MKRILKILFCILIGIILLPAVLYFIPFHGNTLSSDKETWNTFSYVWGASLGTGISAITLFILLLDRKSDSYEKKTNQFIEFLFRQNDMITKHFVSGGYTESPVDEVFMNYNKNIVDCYLNYTVFNYLTNQKLANCEKDIQEYICFGYQISRKTDKSIDANTFDNELSDNWKMQSIKNAVLKTFDIINDEGDKEKTLIDTSSISNNFDIIQRCNLPYNPKLINELLTIKKDSKITFPYSFYSFLNTSRYTIKHLINYPEGLTVYFSQLTLEQKIFIAYDISSYPDNTIFKKIINTKILREELLTDEVRDNGLLINYIYKLK